MPECKFTDDGKHCRICYYGSHLKCCYCNTKWTEPPPEDTCEDDGSEENKD